MIVQSRDKNINIRMILLHLLYAFRRADDAHQLDVPDARFLQEGDGRGRAAAGREHRVYHNGVTFFDIGRHFEIILDGFQGLRIAEQADVANLDVGHHADHTVHHAEPGTEDGDNRELLAGNPFAVCHGNRCFDVDRLQGEISRGFIAHQHGDLRDDLTELLYAGVLIAQNRQLVLNQGMIEYANIAHGPNSFS